MKLLDLKIGTRIAASFAVVLLLLVSVLGVGIYAQKRSQERIETILHEANEKVAQGNQMLQQVMTQAAHTSLMIVTTDEATRQRLTQLVQEAYLQYQRARDQLGILPNTQQENAQLKDIDDAMSRALPSMQEVHSLLLGQATQEATQIMLSDVVPALERAMGLLSKLTAANAEMMLNEGEMVEAEGTRARLIMLALGAVALLLSACVGWLMTRSITRPLAKAVELARAVADGDLQTKVRVHSQDETGQLMQALNIMSQRLSDVVGAVRQGTDSIATASNQIAAGNQDLSARTEKQAAALEETAAAMEELTAAVKQNAAHAHQADALAVTASNVAVSGGQVVSDVVLTMSAIDGASRKIVDITDVIDGIAFQTNILALNAAVEAARAGEQGRGFAVVASEVRTLAQRSSNAAREIKALIDDTVDKVAQGNEQVAQAGKTMEDIVASIRRVTDVMAEISAASTEQTQGIGQVSQTLSQMDQVTQQNAALVEESAAASNAMKAQAGQLQESVQVFRL